MDRLIVFLFGAIVGSFLNVCIYRMPKGKSIIFPSSHCPKCAKSVRWYDNIPVLSYLALRGRCRDCGEKISLIYPLVEILTASVVLTFYVTFGFNAKFFIYSALGAALVAATFIDLAINEIPDEISLGGLAAGLIAALSFPSLFDTDVRWISLASSVFGALAGGGSIYLMGLFGRLAFRKEAMGGGDVKLMAMIGSVIGWKLALVTFFMAPFFGSVAGLMAKFKDGRDTIAYGPYLSLAALTAILFGGRIIDLLFFQSM